MKESFADRLHRARKEAGMTQTDLARRAGMVTPQISRFENGIGEPSLKNFRSLVLALRDRITADELLFGKPKPKAGARQTPEAISEKEQRIIDAVKTILRKEQVR